MPSYVGHIGCAPIGAAAVGEACMFGAPGASGYDDCAKGSVCSNYRSNNPGICKAICDPQGGNPMCSSTTSCVTYAGLFAISPNLPAAGGVCDPSCDPLEDNDFDGPGTAFTRAGTVCSGSQTIGCYGYPSFGTPPKSSWSCTADINYGASLFHRVPCSYTPSDPYSCADPGPTIYVNSCNQGHLPLLYEMTGTTTVICVAMCRPANCYAGNCGTNDEDRLGQAPHRCNSIDRRGTFDVSIGGEHCDYLWDYEIDQQGTFLRSPTSDTLGFCFDHSKYLYDSDGNNSPDTALPACAALQLTGTGSAADLDEPTVYFGAKDLGCVSSTLAGLFTGKQLARRTLFDRPRPLYGPTLGQSGGQ